MKRFLLSISLVLCVSVGFCQQQYFVFIQEAGHQPFYVRMGDKSHSSSAGGHLILSKLQDSTYTFFVGFPKGRAPEQQFVVAINKQDRGYELKNMSGQWQLFDLQTLELLKPVAVVMKEAGNTQQKKTDSYSQLMAGVVNDSSVLYENTAGREAEKKKDTLVKSAVSAGIEKTKDTGSVARDLAIAETKKTVVPEKKTVPEPVVKTDSQAAGKAVVVAARPVNDGGQPNIIRYSTENTIEGKLMIYIDHSAAVSDTIRLIIPNL